MTYLKTGGKWLLQLLLAVVMTGSGIDKFTGPAWERMFRVWGYPDGFYLVIGGVEAVGGIGLLIPKTASYSAIVLAVVMVSAAATQILRGGRNGVGELVFASLLTLIAVVRWRDRMRFAAAPPKPAPAN
jgi:putative oxidoreductase